MATFDGFTLTDKGRNLMAKAQTGTQLKFIRVAVGDGELGSTPITSLNALISEKKSLGISKLKTLSGGKSVVGTILSNQEVTIGFYYRELGIFAQDPELGEILYCYTNAGANAEFIAPGGGPVAIEKYIDAIMVIGNATNVSAVIDGSLIWATQQEVSESLVAAKQYADEKISNIAVPVKSVNGKTGEVNLNASDVGAAPSSHTHGISAVTGLQSALDGKANSTHSHTIASVTGLQSALDGKANSSHSHAISNITGLQSALDVKVSTDSKTASGTLQTSEKSNLVGAINEVFTGVVDLKTKVAAAVNDMGVPTSPTDTGDQMAANIRDIFTGLKDAKITMSLPDRIGFSSNSNPNVSQFTMPISGLDFTPEFIVCKMSHAAVGSNGGTDFGRTNYFTKTTNPSRYIDAPSNSITVNGQNWTIELTLKDVTFGGCTLTMQVYLNSNNNKMTGNSTEIILFGV